MNVLTRVAALALIVAVPAHGQPKPSPDVADIEAVQQAQEDAWNAHDSARYSALFAPDADIVNVVGWWWKGRAELRDKLALGFDTVFARSRLHIVDVAVRPVSAGLYVAHVRWTMTGATSPDGSGGNVPHQGIQTQLLRKIDGRWRIVVFQNTNSVPQKAFAPPR